MRTREPIQCMCDGCGRTGTGHRITATVLAPDGPVSMQTLDVPYGWRVAVVRPDLALPPGQRFDARMDAQTLARATGAPVEAALCERCTKRATFTPLDEAPAQVPSMALAPDAPATDVDERALAVEAERQRLETDLEAAERAEFERKRKALPTTPDGMQVDVDAAMGGGT